MSQDPEHEPVVYNLGATMILPPDKRQVFEQAARQIGRNAAELLEEWLPGYTVEANDLIEVEPGGSAVENTDEFDRTGLVGRHGPSGVLLVELPLALTFITGLLGGAALPCGDPKPLTAVETRVLDLITGPLVNSAAETLLAGSITLDRVANSGFLASSDQTASFGFDFTINGPAGGGRLVLQLDTQAMQELSDLIDRRLSRDRQPGQSQISPAAVHALEYVPMQIGVGFGPIQLPAAHIADLRPGDVIRTGQAVGAQPSAFVGQVRLFEGTLGKIENRLVLEIGQIDDHARRQQAEETMSQAPTQYEMKALRSANPEPIQLDDLLAAPLS